MVTVNNILVNQPDYRVGLSKESVDILQRLRNIHTEYFFKPDPLLVKKLKGMDSLELDKVLESFFKEMIEEECIKDPAKFLDRLATVIPMEKLQEIVKDDVGDALKAAKAMLVEANLYLQMTEGNLSPSLKTRISCILDGIVSIIESIIEALGIINFFSPSESDIHADFKSQKVMMLVSMISMACTLLLPILGAVTGGLIIGGVLLSIAALSLIWPIIKPKTTHLPANAENWTKEIQNKGFLGHGRKESLDEIANILKMNRHAILVGPSRVGKSLTAKAFVQAIERGDYPELKGKTVFRINTTDIVGQKASFMGGGNNILNRISSTMGRHRDDIILVLDEIHMACKNNEKIADQLKTFLDAGGEFPHVIGITTEQEYDKYVKDNNAFALRFDPVKIENTSPDETLKAMADTLLKSRSKPLLKDDVLDYIYQKASQAKDDPQPASAIKLLKKCINRTEKTQKSPTQKKIIEVSNKILSLRTQAAASRGRKKEIQVQLVELEQQLGALQEELYKNQKELDKLFKAKNLLDRVTKETYLSVLKVSSISHKQLSAKDKKQLNKFLLLHEFLGRTLESHIEEVSQKLGMKTAIDKDLVDDIINVA